MDLHDAPVLAGESDTDVELLALVVAHGLEPVAQPDRGRRGAAAVRQHADLDGFLLLGPGHRATTSNLLQSVGCEGLRGVRGTESDLPGAPLLPSGPRAVKPDLAAVPSQDYGGSRPNVHAGHRAGPALPGPPDLAAAVAAGIAELVIRYCEGLVYATLADTARKPKE